jgi:hypothetical protein
MRRPPAFNLSSRTGSENAQVLKLHSRQLPLLLHFEVERRFIIKIIKV